MGDEGLIDVGIVGGRDPLGNGEHHCTPTNGNGLWNAGRLSVEWVKEWQELCGRCIVIKCQEGE